MFSIPFILPLTNMSLTGKSQQTQTDREDDKETDLFSFFKQSVQINVILSLGSVYTVVAITVERFTTLRGYDKVILLFIKS